MAPRGTAFFDLDHTLLDGDSDTSFLDYLAIHGGLDPAVIEAKAPIAEAYMAGEPWQEPYRVILRNAYGGRSVTETNALAVQHVEDCVLGMLFPGARALLDEQRAARERVVLLTTTNQAVAGPVARALGMDGLLSTELEVKGDRYSGELVNGYCNGPGKAEALLGHCARFNVDPRDCAMFGDGRSDMEALAAVGEPVAVHPTPGLLEEATRSGWRVLDLGV